MKMVSGIRIRYRADDRLFNPRRLNVKTRIHEVITRDLLFTDDSDISTTAKPEMKRCLDRLSAACGAFGLVISTTKMR